MNMKFKSTLLASLSLALTLGTSSVVDAAAARDTSLIWRINGDPLLDATYSGQGFGYQKFSLHYPADSGQVEGTLSNKWYRVATAAEDPTLRGKKGETEIPKSEGSWYATSLQTPAQKRAVAIFGTVTHAAVQEYEDWRAMKDLNPSGGILHDSILAFQRRDNDQTVIYQDKGVDANAYYMGRSVDRKGKVTPSSLNAFHFKSKKDGTTIYTGDSSDVMIHEAGHKRLNDMHPGYFDVSSDELGGFHEGYGDTYSLIYSVRDPAQRRLAFKQAGYNLHSSDNILSSLGEQFGQGLKLTGGLRNLDTNKIWGQTEMEVHEIGHIWGGGWYDVMADAHRYVLGMRYRDRMTEGEIAALSDQALLDVGNYVARLSLASTLLVTEPTPTLGHFASKALQLVQERTPLTGIAEVDGAPWEVAIKGHFGLVRQIPVQGPGSGNFTIKKGKGVCGTGHCREDD